MTTQSAPTTLGQPYPEYKPSVVAWLGNVPAHWQLLPAKRLFRECVEKGHPDEQMLAVTQDQGVIPKAELDYRTVTAQKDLHNLKLVKPGQFVISLRSFQGGIEYSRYRGITSPAYTVLNPLINFSDHYYSYLLKSHPFIDQLSVLVASIREGQNINYDDFSVLPLPLPPLAEQQAIAAFLDTKTAQIDAYIAKKRRLIELLRERRAAVIQQAVTRGLDPNVPLRPSGIPWLGDTPAHWEVRKLKWCLSQALMYGANESAESDNKNWPRFIRITDLEQDGTLREDTFKSLPPDLAANYLLEEGDILLARSGATVGKAFLFSSFNGTACFAGYLIKAKANPHLILPEFLYQFTQGTGYLQWKDSINTLNTIQNISAEKYANLMVSVPPLDEQKSILNYLSSQNYQFFNACAITEREISLLQEYRTALIAAAVTGKLDVR